MVEKGACAGTVPSGDEAGMRVGDVMVRRPKTLAADTTVGAVRALFASPRAANALLVDGDAFAGVLTRDDLPASLPDTAPARAYARRDVPTITLDRPVAEARTILDTDALGRLVVLETDGVTLAGLLCLDPKRRGFCRG